ncbi:hypothetical protein Droror1_Dr00011545 [Drosera rotundifolia]
MVASVDYAASSDSVHTKNRSSGFGRSTSYRHGGRGAPTRGYGSGSRGRSRQRAAPVTGDPTSVYCYKCGYPNYKANVCEALSFRKWFDDAVAAALREPNATTLSTTEKDGKPLVNVQIGILY